MSLNEAASELFLQQIDSIVDEYGVSREQAFLRWICENILDLSEEGKIDEAVSIDGKDDRGVDIFHYESSGDEIDQYVTWIQAKFSNTLDHVVTREEIRDFGHTIGDLESCPLEANNIFKQKSSEFIQLGGVESRIRKRMYFVCSGSLNAQAKELINSNEWKQQVIGNLSGPLIEFEVIDIDNILSHIITPETQRIRIKFDGAVIPRNDTTTNKKSIVGYVNAPDIVDIVRKHKETLFLENPRQTLGKSTPTNKAIMGTLNNPALRPKFWKLNNGITAICSHLEEVIDHPGEYDIDNFKVVNGRQTTFTLEQFVGPLDDISLSLTVHEAVDGRERNFISQATNTQNPVKPVDLITNFAELNNLVLQCKQNFDKKFYFERQTKGFKVESVSTRNRVTSRRVLEKNSSARSFYSYSINPNDAMMPDKDLFSATNPIYYNQVFTNREIRDLIVPHIFMTMLKSLQKNWTDEIRSDPPILIHLRDKEILGKDIVKYYVLRFISLSLNSLPDDQRIDVENKLIEIFQSLDRTDLIPDNLKEIAIAAYNNFKSCYDMAPSETWPDELLERLNQPGYQPTADDVPTGYEVMYELKKRGNQILPHLIRTKNNLVTEAGHDRISESLLNLTS